MIFFLRQILNKATQSLVVVLIFPAPAGMLALSYAHAHSTTNSPLVETLEALHFDLKSGTQRIRDSEIEAQLSIFLEQTINNLNEEHQKLLLEPIAKRFFIGLKDFAKHKLNISKLVPWVKSNLIKRGPRFVLANVFTEVMENLIIVFVAKNPQYAFLLPLSFTHSLDIVGYSLFLAVPEIWNHITKYRSHGGLFSGAQNYFRHLQRSRAITPLDWSVVLDIQRINIGPADSVTPFDVITLKDSILERWLPDSMRKFFQPHRIAQREATVSFSIRELEKLCLEAQIDLNAFKNARSEPAVYSRILIHELMIHDEGKSRLQSAILAQNPKSPTVEQHPFDLGTLTRRLSLSALEQSGLTPSQLAERFYFYLGDLADFQLRQVKGNYFLKRRVFAIIEKDILPLTYLTDSTYRQVYRSARSALHLIKSASSPNIWCQTELASLASRFADE
ncbi:MAG: hypothetical protein IT289_10450 [Oligoflexia bacterium]|nr:hypothetical protein [Oligoflexia bacterium]